MPVTGPFADLRALQRKVARLTTSAFRREMSQAIADEARKQIDYSFEHSVSPYDSPWAPLKYRSGKPLVDEGHLRRALTAPQAAVVTEQGFVITTRGFLRAFDSVRNLATHQYGKTIMAKGRPMRFRVGGSSRANGSQWVSAQQVTVPQRQVMPEGMVGSRWGRAFRKAADAVMAKAVG